MNATKSIWIWCQVNYFFVPLDPLEKLLIISPNSTGRGWFFTGNSGTIKA
jgi:hypothetical protein